MRFVILVLIIIGGILFFEKSLWCMTGSALCVSCAFLLAKNEENEGDMYK